MRKIKKIPFFLDVEFADSISPEQIKEVAEKVALALSREISDGNGFSPEPTKKFDGTVTNKIRIMCKNVVLVQEDFTKMDGYRHVEVKDIS